MRNLMDGVIEMAAAILKKKKTVVVPQDAILGSVHSAYSTYVDSESRAMHERLLATALARAAKYGLRLLEDSERGLVFMAHAHTPAQSCRQMMLFFKELKTDFAKQGLELRFGMTRGHELKSAELMGTSGSAGEILLNRQLMQSMPALSMKSRVIGQMRFAAA